MYIHTQNFLHSPVPHSNILSNLAVWVGFLNWDLSTASRGLYQRVYRTPQTARLLRHGAQTQAAPVTSLPAAGIGSLDILVQKQDWILLPLVTTQR